MTETSMTAVVEYGPNQLKLEKNGIRSSLFRTGQFATSLDMAGFSITLTKLDDELANLLNADAGSFAYSTARS